MPMVRSKVRRVFGSGGDSEEVVQEVFLCLYRRVHTLRDPVALRAFVMAVASRTVSHERRRRRLRFPQALESEERGAEELRVPANPAAKHAFASLKRLISRLRQRDREAFVLRFIEGMDAAEVAAALGVSAPTARRSFSRASKRITLWAGRDPFLADFMPREGY
jgi:RNA polymerase sigma-70 factor, ECF subfamily